MLLRAQCKAIQERCVRRMSGLDKHGWKRDYLKYCMESWKGIMEDAKKEEEFEMKLEEATVFCPDMSMVWEWFSPAHQQWFRYDKALSLCIEVAHGKGMKKLRLTIEGMYYLFLLQARSVVDLSDGSTLQIRRQMPTVEYVTIMPGCMGPGDIATTKDGLPAPSEEELKESPEAYAADAKGKMKKHAFMLPGPDIDEQGQENPDTVRGPYARYVRFHEGEPVPEDFIDIDGNKAKKKTADDDDEEESAKAQDDAEADGTADQNEVAGEEQLGCSGRRLILKYKEIWKEDCKKIAAVDELMCHMEIEGSGWACRLQAAEEYAEEELEKQARRFVTYFPRSELSTPQSIDQVEDGDLTLEHILEGSAERDKAVSRRGAFGHKILKQAWGEELCPDLQYHLSEY